MWPPRSACWPECSPEWSSPSETTTRAPGSPEPPRRRCTPSTEVNRAYRKRNRKRATVVSREMVNQINAFRDVFNYCLLVFFIIIVSEVSQFVLRRDIYRGYWLHYCRSVWYRNRNYVVQREHWRHRHYQGKITTLIAYCSLPWMIQ